MIYLSQSQLLLGKTNEHRTTSRKALLQKQLFSLNIPGRDCFLYRKLSCQIAKELSRGIVGDFARRNLGLHGTTPSRLEYLH